MFQGLQAIYDVRNEILAEISLDKEGDYIAHPAVLDSCLQSIVGIFLSKPELQTKTYMPVSIKSVWLNGLLPQHVWVKIDKSTLILKDKQLTVSLEIYNTEGELIAFIEQLSLSEVTEKQIAAMKGDTVGMQELYYEWQWVLQRSANAYARRLPLESPVIHELVFNAATVC